MHNFHTKVHRWECVHCTMYMLIIVICWNEITAKGVILRQLPYNWIWKHSFYFMLIAWFSILENMHFFSFTFNCTLKKISLPDWGTFTVFHYNWCIRLRYIEHIISSSFLFHFVSFFDSHWIGSFNTSRRSVSLRCIPYVLNISLVFQFCLQLFVTMLCFWTNHLRIDENSTVRSGMKQKNRQKEPRWTRSLVFRINAFCIQLECDCILWIVLWSMR